MTVEEVISYFLEGEGVDVLRESLGWVCRQLMGAEVSELVGAARGERAPAQRLLHRNGYRNRAWQGRAGELELQIPKLRRGSYWDLTRRGQGSAACLVQDLSALFSDLQRSLGVAPRLPHMAPAPMRGENRRRRQDLQSQRPQVRFCTSQPHESGFARRRAACAGRRPLHASAAIAGVAARATARTGDTLKP
jgi:Transposase, Mutator family